MNETPLEDQVHDALHRRADGVQRAPFDVTDVRTRARRIKRRRAAVAGVAVAAALAVAVPVGLTMVGPAQRSDVPLAPQPPAAIASGTVLVDPRSAPDGEPPGVPVLDVNSPALVVGDEVTDLPDLYDQITPYGDGWAATPNVEGALTFQVLDADLEPQGEPVVTTGLSVSPDRTRIVWTEYDGTRWSVVEGDTATGTEVHRTELPPSPRESWVTTVGFASGDRVVATQSHVDDSPTTTFLVDGEETVEVPEPFEATVAHPGTGLVAGVVERSADGTCSGVIEAGSPAAEPAWTTCDLTLVSFSHDGRYAVGFSSHLDGPVGSPTMEILDAATGEPVVDYEMAGDRTLNTGFAEVAWEDDQTLVAVVVSSNLQYVVRVGLDGTVERVGGQVRTLDPDMISAKLAES